MNQNIIATFHAKPYRFHQTETGLSAIAWIYIHMLTPETLRTVIGIAVPFYKHTAISAGKIFNVALKFFVHWSALTFFAWLSRSKVRFRLGDTEAARSKSQWSCTNSLNSMLYSIPTVKFVPRVGTNASRTFLFWASSC